MVPIRGKPSARERLRVIENAQPLAGATKEEVKRAHARLTGGAELHDSQVEEILGRATKDTTLGDVADIGEEASSG